MDWKLKNRPEAKISEESAQAQILSLLEFYQIDVETMGPDQKKAVDTSLAKVTAFVRQGMVDIQAPKVIQHLRTPPGAVSAIEYGEVTGKNMVAMDGRSTDDIYGRIYALLGSVSGLGEDAFRALKGIDLSVAENLGMLFISR
jgi:hypothetical protein